MTSAKTKTTTIYDHLFHRHCRWCVELLKVLVWKRLDVHWTRDLRHAELEIPVYQVCLFRFGNLRLGSMDRAHFPTNLVFCTQEIMKNRVYLSPWKTFEYSRISIFLFLSWLIEVRRTEETVLSFSFWISLKLYPLLFCLLETHDKPLAFYTFLLNISTYLWYRYNYL